MEVAPPTSGPLLRLKSPGQDLSVWRIDDWVGTPHNAAPEDHDEIGWFTLEQSRILDIANSALGRLLERELGRLSTARQTTAPAALSFE